MNYKLATFATSAVGLDDCPQDSLREVAFAGRSNAGKSSAINTLTNQTRLARISKTPGRTQLINFFSVVPGRYLVDLPGYGYAKVPMGVKVQWQRHLEQYLHERSALAGLVLLTDIRHVFKDFDLMMIDWARQSNMPMHVLLTKSDKLKRGAAQNTLLNARKMLSEHPGITVQLFSSLNKTGVDSLVARLDGWLTIPSAEGAEGEGAEGERAEGERAKGEEGAGGPEGEGPG